MIDSDSVSFITKTQGMRSGDFKAVSSHELGFCWYVTTSQKHGVRANLQDYTWGTNSLSLPETFNVESSGTLMVFFRVIASALCTLHLSTTVLSPVFTFYWGGWFFIFSTFSIYTMYCIRVKIQNITWTIVSFTSVVKLDTILGNSVIVHIPFWVMV